MTIISSIPRIIELLKEKKLWNEFYSKTNEMDTIPYYLDSVRNINQKVFSFMNTMLSEIEVKRFKKDKQTNTMNVKTEIEKIKENWKRDYGRIKIVVEVNDELEFPIYNDVLQVILDNLILNSIQNNDNKKSLNINIRIEKRESFLDFHYSDNGQGLHDKYIKDPMSILEVHETSREDGHGLGMWIVNNTVIDTGGEISKIYNNKGFNIEFYLGVK